jgi:hypothetical protein
MVRLMLETVQSSFDARFTREIMRQPQHENLAQNVGVVIERDHAFDNFDWKLAWTQKMTTGMQSEKCKKSCRSGGRGYSWEKGSRLEGLESRAKREPAD